MRKSQVKFGEAFAVVIIVYVIFMLGLVWYNSINNKEIAKISKADLMDRSFEKYYYLVNLDLIHTSESTVIDNEFDFDSMRVFAQYTQDGEGRDYITQKLGNAFISVEMHTYDTILAQEDIEPLILYDNLPDEENFERETFKTLIPVKDQKTSTTYLGLLTVVIPS